MYMYMYIYVCICMYLMECKQSFLPLRSDAGLPQGNGVVKLQPLASGGGQVHLHAVHRSVVVPGLVRGKDVHRK